MNRHAACSARRAQLGQGLLLLMLVMLVAGAALLLEGIGSRASIRAGDEERTARALALAKEALIAYAVMDSNRPGELPCPDFNRDGIINPIGNEDYAHPNCRTRLGWLPWRTLDMEDVRDGAGEHLWYAVADDYFARSGSGPRPPLNPDTLGGITVDAAGATDIVAVIIAPGEARGAQSRPADPPGGAPDADAHVAEYLEGGNETVGSTAYVTTGGADFNDRVIYITARELMRAVEQRVLAELGIALRSYSASWGATEPVFPWMKAFEDPRFAANFHGVAGQTAGLLPMHAPAAGEEMFTTPWLLKWSDLTKSPDYLAETTLGPVTVGLLTIGPFTQPGTVTADDLQNGPPDGIAMSESADNCTWFSGAAGRVRCTGVGTMQTGVPVVELFGFQVVSSERVISVTGMVDLDNGSASTPDNVRAPTASEVRTRDVTQTVFGTDVLGVVAEIEIVDHVVLNVLGVLVSLQSGAGRLTLNSDSAGTMTVEGVRYWLDPRRELPVWFTENGWHQYVFVAASPANLGQGSMDCVASANCLSLLGSDGSPSTVDVGLAVIGAGRQLAGQTRTPGPAPPEEFLEQENVQAVMGADTVAHRSYSAGFNDRVYVVEPAPSPAPAPPIAPPPVPPPVAPF